MINDNIEHIETANKFMKKISVVNAITFIDMAWEEIKTDNIIKCFEKSVFYNDEISLLEPEQAKDDKIYFDIDEEKYKEDDFWINASTGKPIIESIKEILYECGQINKIFK